MLVSYLRAADDTAGSLHALDVSSPIQHSAAAIVLGFPCIASPALSVVTTMNRYIFLRYSYYNPSTVIDVN
jgi:hypothetical protein